MSLTPDDVRRLARLARTAIELVAELVVGLAALHYLYVAQTQAVFGDILRRR